MKAMKRPWSIMETMHMVWKKCLWNHKITSGPTRKWFDTMIKHGLFICFSLICGTRYVSGPNQNHQVGANGLTPPELEKYVGGPNKQTWF